MGYFFTSRKMTFVASYFEPKMMLYAEKMVVPF